METARPAYICTQGTSNPCEYLIEDPDDYLAPPYKSPGQGGLKVDSLDRVTEERSDKHSAAAQASGSVRDQAANEHFEPEDHKQLAAALQAFYKCKWPEGKKNEKWLGEAATCREKMQDFWGKVVRARCERLQNMNRNHIPASQVDGYVTRGREVSALRKWAEPKEEARWTQEAEEVRAAVAAEAAKQKAREKVGKAREQTAKQPGRPKGKKRVSSVEESFTSSFAHGEPDKPKGNKRLKETKDDTEATAAPPEAGPIDPAELPFALPDGEPEIQEEEEDPLVGIKKVKKGDMDLVDLLWPADSVREQRQFPLVRLCDFHETCWLRRWEDSGRLGISISVYGQSNRWSWYCQVHHTSRS